MSRFEVEFVGGPYDGVRRVMPDARPEWWLPWRASSATGLAGRLVRRPVVTSLVYRRRTPALGERRLLYDLVDEG